MSVKKTQSIIFHSSTSLLKLAAFLCSPLLISSCVTELPKVDLNFKEVGTPAVRKSGYDDALYDFGKMLQAYTGKSAKHPLYIQSKNISNDTAAGGLPNNVSRMVVTTLTKIGGPVVYIPYDPLYLQQERATSGVFIRQNPEVVVTGAITEFDKALVSESDSTKVSLSPPVGGQFQPDVSADKRARSDEAKLAIDFSMLDYKTQTSMTIPTSNTISIKKSVKTGGMSFNIFGLGLGIEGSVTQSQGIHAAIRSLIEVSLIQLLGRAYKLPYWKLMPGAAEDARLTREILDEFHGAAPDKLVKWILRAYGHCAGDYPEGKQGMLARLSKVGQDRGKSYNFSSFESIPDDVMIDLYYNVPIGTNLARCELKEARQEEAGQEEAAEQQQPAAHSKPPSEGLSLTLTSDKGKKPQYKLGETITLSIGTSKNSHVYCYWEQGNGSTIRIFPNRFHESSLVRKNKTVTVPDDNMPFMMKTEFPNANEKIGCFASVANLSSKLPARIVENDLSEINGAKISDISAAFSSAGDVSSQVLPITVR